MKKLIVLGVLVFVLCGCQSSTATESLIDKEPIIQQEETAINFTATIKPTERPTATQKPTNTPQPTLTSTPYPEPIILIGSGDDIIDLDWPYGVAIVEITGNSSSRYFGVKTLDENNEFLDQLVNTTDPYNGTRLINIVDNERVARFEIKAAGEWEIIVKYISELRTVEVPGAITGIGDDVFAIPSKNCDIAEIEGNSTSSYFGVFTYSTSEGKNYVVNTTDPYNGKVMCPKDTLLIEVISPMEMWSITFQ